MPSKEYEALVEKVATVLNEQEGCYLQPQDYHRGAAKEVLSAIRAALQEPNANQEQSGMREIMGGTGYVNHEIYIDPETPWHTWRAMLAASALGEQSE